MVDAERLPGLTASAGVGEGRAPQLEGQRELCIWLGTLAALRGGLIKQLIGYYDNSVERLLSDDPARIASLCVQRSRPPRAAPHSRDERERSGERARFAACLAAGPAACADEALALPAGRAVLAWCDPLYPPALRHLPDPPPCLFARAASSTAELERRLRTLRAQTSVAIVGTRAPSAYGEEMASTIASGLTARGALVVSGMAMGIDACAQRSALRTSRRSPSTVGVLGCGADVVYPKANAHLFGEVAERGVLLSEFPWGMPARAWRFPARNRVIAALTRAVVVVEGAQRSGALITALFSLELGREVFAVPGEAGRRLSAGPHELLRKGACFCECAADVVRELEQQGCSFGAPSEPSSAATPRWPGLEDERAAGVLRALESGPLTPDATAVVSGLSVHSVAAVLSALEVEGLVRRCEGGVYRLRPGG